MRPRKSEIKIDNDALCVDTVEAARMLSLSPGTLENMRYTKGRYDGPPFARIGHKVVYPVQGLQDWLAACTVRG